jgi:hypothetical protein
MDRLDPPILRAASVTLAAVVLLAFAGHAMPSGQGTALRRRRLHALLDTCMRRSASARQDASPLAALAHASEALALCRILRAAGGSGLDAALGTDTALVERRLERDRGRIAAHVAKVAPALRSTAPLPTLAL